MNFLHFFVYLKNHDCGVLLTIIFKNLILYSRRKQKHKFSLNIFAFFSTSDKTNKKKTHIFHIQLNMYIHHVYNLKSMLYIL